MYEERLKLPLQRDALDDGAMKVSSSVMDLKMDFFFFYYPCSYLQNITMQQRLGDNVGQLLDPNHASILKAAAAGGQPPG